MELQQAKDQLEFDTFVLLVGIYRREYKGFFPFIEELYTAYLMEWEKENVDFLHTNKETFDLEDEDFINIEQRFDEFGIHRPSIELVGRWLDALTLSYIDNEGRIFNSAVVNVW